MARGAAQAQRKRPRPQQAKPKRKQKSWEDELFFARLRRHTKWMFVLLALVFGVGFVAFGVGSGSTGVGGIGDIFNSVFGGSSSGIDSPIKSDQKKLAANPGDVQSAIDLSTLYQQKQENAKAVSVLKSASAEKPKNLDLLNAIAGIYRNDASAARNKAADAQNALSERHAPRARRELVDRAGLEQRPALAVAADSGHRGLLEAHLRLLESGECLPGRGYRRPRHIGGAERAARGRRGRGRGGPDHRSDVRHPARNRRVQALSQARAERRQREPGAPDPPAARALPQEVSEALDSRRCELRHQHRAGRRRHFRDRALGRGRSLHGPRVQAAAPGRDRQGRERDRKS